MTYFWVKIEKRHYNFKYLALIFEPLPEETNIKCLAKFSDNIQ